MQPVRPYQACCANPKMRQSLYVLIALAMGSVESATNMTQQGCNLYVPEEVRDHMEAEGEPLQITIIMQIEYVRDVPDSGGSFGVVFR